MSQAQPINEASAESEQRSRPRRTDARAALVMVIGGVGGLDWCGIALRHLLKNRQPPYAIQIVPWGLGFGRWHADLTNVVNRDAKARRDRRGDPPLQGRPTGMPGLRGRQIRRRGSRGQGPRIAG